MYNIKRIKATKRKIYNFNKADWKQLNNDLKHVKWDHLIMDTTSTLNSWNIFKDILFKICDKHIPKITIKSNIQPPWFRHDSTWICIFFYQF